MKTRKQLEREFSNFPDVVTSADLMQMMGVCDQTAYRLLRKNSIQHFVIGGTYRIPKVSIIDYMLTDDYEAYRRKIEYYHICRVQDKVERGQQKILFMCDKPQTRKELMFMLDISSNKTFFRVYMRPLLESGQIRMLYPDRPSISIQRYVRADVK